MVYLIVIAVVEFLLIIVFGRIVYKSFLTISELDEKSKVNHDKAKKNFSELSTYLKTRKSKLSMESKIDILNKWQDILLSLPKDVSGCTWISPDNIDFEDKTTVAQHKKIVIESLNELLSLDYYNLELLSCVAYHLMYLLFK